MSEIGDILTDKLSELRLDTSAVATDIEAAIMELEDVLGKTSGLYYANLNTNRSVYLKSAANTIFKLDYGQDGKVNTIDIEYGVEDIQRFIKNKTIVGVSLRRNNSSDALELNIIVNSYHPLNGEVTQGSYDASVQESINIIQYCINQLEVSDIEQISIKEVFSLDTQTRLDPETLAEDIGTSVDEYSVISGLFAEAYGIRNHRNIAKKLGGQLLTLVTKRRSRQP